MIFSGIRLAGVGNIRVFDFMLNSMQYTSAYILKNVDGLGPPDLEMNTAELPGEGSVFQNRRSGTRVITLTVGFRPNYKTYQNVGELRQELYYLLDTRGGSPITISLRNYNNTSNVLVTKGYITKMEANVFTKTPELVITIECMRPYLESPTIFSTSPSSMPEGNVTNPGNAETGFELTVPIIKAMNSFSVQRTGSYAASLVFNRGVLRGDIFNINTTYGNKQAYLSRNRGTDTVNLLPFISSSSDWFNLFPGVNRLKFGPSDDGIGTPVFSFTPKYWGV